MTIRAHVLPCADSIFFESVKASPITAFPPSDRMGTPCSLRSLISKAVSTLMRSYAHPTILLYAMAMSS